MRIAQVSPLFESVPPKLYGGTERVVSHLTEELVRLGHDVTLFASGDSSTAAHLVPSTPNALRLDPTCGDPVPHHIVQLEQLLRQASQFDIIHFHIDCLHFPIARRLAVPHLTTLHGRLDLPDLVPLYAAFSDMPVVSISRAQREPLPQLNWMGTVYHGVPRELFAPGPGGEYLAFLGRLSPEKRAQDAVRIAQQARMPLKIAAKLNKWEEPYFDAEIRPLMRGGGVEYVGEIGDAEKGDFLGRAAALLFPIDWPEPFGLAMIEALACGTPVIARDRGSVRELLVDGESGYIFQELHQAVGAVRRLNRLSRARCRAIFEERFTATRMAEDYLKLYQAAEPLEAARRLAGETA